MKTDDNKLLTPAFVFILLSCCLLAAGFVVGLYHDKLDTRLTAVERYSDDMDNDHDVHLKVLERFVDRWYEEQRKEATWQNTTERTILSDSDYGVEGIEYIENYVPSTSPYCPFCGNYLPLEKRDHRMRIVSVPAIFIPDNRITFHCPLCGWMLKEIAVDETTNADSIRFTPEDTADE